MDDMPGHKSGQGASGFTWGEYLDWLIASVGSLAGVAEKLCAARGFTEDIGSIEHALRRLRDRGNAPGGKWGQRAIDVFGLPEQVEARVRWMGVYHSRFTDLPVAICEDLVRLWDRPPATDAIRSRTWLFLARGTVALRKNDFETAAVHLSQARLGIASLSAEAEVELLLVEAFVASRKEPARVGALLGQVEPLLRCVVDPNERACLHARWIDQRAYELNKGRIGPADPAAAEALYREIADDHAPPFARCRRANGLAYACWKQGRPGEGAAFARAACQHAGDGGHVRMHAMALAMLGRILDTPEGDEATRRANEIALRLDDEMLSGRFSRARS